MKKILAVIMCVMLLAGCSSGKTGLGIISARSAVGAGSEKDGRAQATSTVCALTLDKKGKVLDISIDSVQVKFDFDSSGKITNDITEKSPTHKELKEDLGMKKNSSIDREWYEQVEFFEEWAMGKNIEDVLNAENEEIPEGSKEQPLKASVTIDLSDILEAVERAYENIKAETEAEKTERGK